jgi:hypothetical protein
MAQRKKVRVSQPGLARYLKGGSLQQDFKSFIQRAIEADQKNFDENIGPKFERIERERKEITKRLKTLERFEKKQGLNVLEKDEKERLIERELELIFDPRDYFKLRHEIMAAQLFLSHMAWRDAVLHLNLYMSESFSPGERVYLSDMDELPYTSMN